MTVMNKTVLRDSDLRIFHDLHHEIARSFPEVLSSFSVFLRRIREQLYPVGTKNVRVVRVNNSFNLTLDLGDRLACDFYFGIYPEYLDAFIFLKLQKPESLVIDVGANFGFFSILSAMNYGFKGKIYAFEPNPYARNLLRLNVAQNDLESRIEIFDAAIGDKTGFTNFCITQESSFSGIGDTGRSNIIEQIEVPLISIDQFTLDKKIVRVDLIKVDVEGYEAGVLSGAMNAIQQNPEIVLLIEISSKNLNDKRSSDLLKALKKLYSFGFFGCYVDIDHFKLIGIESPEECLSLEVGRNIFLIKSNSKTKKTLESIVVDLKKKLGGNEFLIRPIDIDLIEAPQLEAFGNFFSFGELKRLQERTESLTSEVGRLTSETVRLESDGAASKAQVAEWRELAKHLQERTESLTSEVGRLTSETVRLESDGAASKAQVAEWRELANRSIIDQILRKLHLKKGGLKLPN
jgi:FkbM family methyltransferase